MRGGYKVPVDWLPWFDIIVIFLRAVIATRNRWKGLRPELTSSSCESVSV